MSGQDDGLHIHPGEVLIHVFMTQCFPPLTIDDVSKEMGLSTEMRTHIIARSVAISNELAEHLGRIRGSSKEFWLGLQRTSDLQSRKCPTALPND